MPYNFFADSFHTKKLCSRLSSSEEGMAPVLKESHSFTCTPRVRPLSEWTILALPLQPKLVLIYRSRRDGRLSWPAGEGKIWAAVSPRLSVTVPNAHGGVPIVRERVCSAGVGRTGTYIAIDTLFRQIEQAQQQLPQPEQATIDVYGVIYRMRMNRVMMVQTEVLLIVYYYLVLTVNLLATKAVHPHKF